MDMKNIALCLTLLAVDAAAQTRTAVKLQPGAPAVVPMTNASPAAIAPSLTAAAALTPALALPAPAVVPADRALPALASIGSALSAPAKGQDEGSVSRAAFDAAKPAKEHDAAVLGSERAAPHDHLARAIPSEPRTRMTPVIEAAEVGLTMSVFAIPAFIARANIGDPVALGLALAAIWGLAAWTGRDHLRRLRQVWVDGWQASHDQKYRVDYATGRQRDIRGHKYGSDRYDKYDKGPAGRIATGLISAAAAAAALAFLFM
jgi:hypothetical protein